MNLFRLEVFAAGIRLIFSRRGRPFFFYKPSEPVKSGAKNQANQEGQRR
jgi:hypothetical protein